jgi:hypothetical protein
VVKGVNIAGMENTDRVRQITQAKIDELFSPMSRRVQIVPSAVPKYGFHRAPSFPRTVITL